MIKRGKIMRVVYSVSNTMSIEVALEDGNYENCMARFTYFTDKGEWEVYPIVYNIDTGGYEIAISEKVRVPLSECVKICTCGD